VTGATTNTPPVTSRIPVTDILTLPLVFLVADVLARRKEMIPDGAEKDVLMDLAAVLMEVLTKTPIGTPI